MQLLKNNEIELLTKCRDITKEDDTSGLFPFMRAVMAEEEPRGVGLAANQVGVLLRAFTISDRGIDINIINPWIDKHSPKKMTSAEGCLSCPGINVSVGRWKWVVLKGVDENWMPIKYKLHGFLSTVAQHEIDHLNGITLLSRVTEAKETCLRLL